MTDLPIRFIPFEAGHAEQVAKLFREVYGDAYPLRWVYEPQQLVEASQRDSYIPFVACATDGQVISYAAICQSAPFKGIYELVQGIVSSDFRGGGIGRAMFEHVEHLLKTLPGAETYFGESVCNHTHTQKAGAHIKSIETGLEVDLMPGSVYAKDTPDRGRIAVLDAFRSFTPNPHKVYLPEPYEEIIRSIYSGFDDSRTLCRSNGTIPEACETELSVRLYETLSVSRIAVSAIGSDFEQLLSDHERSLAGQQIKVIQLWLKSTLPWIGKAVDMLRNRGYFFGGVFPRWFDDDGIMLQKLSDRPNWEGIRLYSERARMIHAAVYKDWLRVAARQEEE